MAIEIQPRGPRVSSGGVGASSQRRGEQAAGGVPAAPKRAGTNLIPTPEVLENLIDRAVLALRQGVAWDRGSILNLLV